MPELPEVKSIQDQLNEYMPLSIISFEKSLVSDSIIHTKIDKLKGKVILKVSRKGKMLDFLLNDGRHLLSHLGMTGTWLISDKKIIEKHTHFQIKANNIFMAYVDPRRFGHMYLLDEKESLKKLDQLGLDLLDKKFDLKYFSSALKKYPHRLIKVSLLDQKLFAGTGNYIANEICAHAKVRPDRMISSLSDKEIKRLYLAINKVLFPAINSGGTTFAGGYRDTTGAKGMGVNHLVVFYQKICQMCKKTKIEKIILAQRGTYFCPRCQK